MQALALWVELLSPHQEAIGFWAGVLTTIAFAPQVIRTWKSHEDGLSGAMLSLFGTGVGLWFVYGLLRQSGPIILANGLTGLQVIFLAMLKIRRAFGLGAAKSQ